MPIFSSDTQCVPQLIELALRKRFSGAFGMDPKQVQCLTPVDISDSGNDRLIEQQSPDGCPAATDSVPRAMRIRIRTQGVGTQTTADLTPLAVGNELALIRAVQVESVTLANDTKSNLSTRLRGRQRVPMKLAVQTQVNVQESAALPFVTEVLAVCVDCFEDAPVDLFCSVGESSLRRRNGETLSDERVAMVSGNSVDRVSFRHLPSYALLPKAGGSGSLPPRDRVGKKFTPRLVQSTRSDLEQQLQLNCLFPSRLSAMGHGKSLASSATATGGPAPHIAYPPVCGGLLFALFRTTTSQSLSASAGGSPTEISCPPETSRTEPSDSSPPVRGLNHMTW